MSSFIEPMLNGISTVQLFDSEKRDSGTSQRKLTRTSSRRVKKFPSDLNLGGRALEAICRPYPIALAGIASVFSFTMKTGVMIATFKHKEGGSRVSEFFLPHLQYPFENEVMFISDCQAGVFDVSYAKQRVSWTCGCSELESSEHTIVFKNAGEKEVGGIHLYEKGRIDKIEKRALCAIL